MATSPHQPTVAVLWHAASTSSFLITAAAAGWVRLAWVIDGSDAETAAFVPLLRRSGVVVDTTGLDAQAVVDELRTLDVGGVVVFDDPPISLGAQLAHRLGLPFHSPETAVRLTDKLAQRAALAEAGVPSAAYAAIAPGDPVPTHVPLPAVLKPRSGQLSRDVVLVHTTAELAERMRMHPDQLMMLEEFLPPLPDLPEHESGVVSVETAWCDGEPTHLGVTGRFPIAPPFLECGTYHPWEGGEEEGALLDVAAAAALAVGVRDGFTHIELKRTPDGPKVIEVNGRLAGLLSEQLRRAGGGDLLRQVLRVGLGLPVEALEPPPGVGWVLWGQPPPGASEVVSIDGIDEVRALPGCEQVRAKRPGEAADPRSGSIDAATWEVVGSSPHHAAMVATRREILSRVHVETR